jgi:hypothetical protein
MNSMIVIAEILLIVGVGVCMQALSIKRPILGKTGRRPTIGYAVLVLSSIPFFHGLPGVLDDGYLFAVYRHVGIVAGVVLSAAIISVATLLVAAHVSDKQLKK